MWVDDIPYTYCNWLQILLEILNRFVLTSPNSQSNCLTGMRVESHLTLMIELERYFKLLLSRVTLSFRLIQTRCYSIHTWIVQETLDEVTSHNIFFERRHFTQCHALLLLSVIIVGFRKPNCNCNGILIQLTKNASVLRWMYQTKGIKSGSFPFCVKQASGKHSALKSLNKQ